MKNILDTFHPAEIFLYIIGAILSAFLEINIVLYVAFIATLCLEVKSYLHTKDFFSILKIIILSVIIPNNYIIIVVIGILSIIYYKVIIKHTNFKIIGLLALILFLNILANWVAPLNIFFGLFYLLPILFIFLLLQAFEEEFQKARSKLVSLSKTLIAYELITVLMTAISNIKLLLEGVNANDWVTGTFGYQQGNIFLYFMLFSLLILKKDYDQTKNKQDIVYIAIAAILSIATNSMALIIFFIFSYFIIMFFQSKAQEKRKTIAILGIVLVLFMLLTPDWIKSYIIKLTNPEYFSKNVAKVQVYEDTFINIPKKDLKFSIIGNGIGQYSSRAALTCTGKYIDTYTKLFAPSISDYTAKYILKRYEHYNLELGHGTLYSPFSTILSVQGEYGVIGSILFICFIIYLMKGKNPYTKIFVLFFFLSCFIENYLEFAKVMTMVFSIYFMNKSSSKEPIEKNKKKNLMFIVPTLIGGGAEKTVANLSKYLAKDYNIYIVVFRDTQTKYSYSGKLIPLTKGRNKSAIKKATFVLKAIPKLRKLKQENHIDYAISFLTQADALNTLSRVAGTQTFISIRNTDSMLMQSKALKLITYMSCKQSDHIIAISNQVKDDLIANFRVIPNKITVIYNPALATKFGKTKQTKHVELLSSGKICINVARLVEQKGQWHLIRAFSKVVKKYPDAKLLILGQGPLKEYLQSLIDAYDLHNNIFLLGFANNPYYYMKKADCFIFSSLYEGLGNSLLEAMSCRTPIISCDCASGPREILAPTTDYNQKTRNKIDFATYGILVPVFDGQQRNAETPLTKEEMLMAQAIIDFFKQNKCEHYREMSKKRSKDFDIKTISQQWKDLLK